MASSGVRSLQKRYNAGSGRLDVTLQLSALSQWYPQPVAEDVAFQLWLQSSGQPANADEAMTEAMTLVAEGDAIALRAISQYLQQQVQSSLAISRLNAATTAKTPVPSPPPSYRLTQPLSYLQLCDLASVLSQYEQVAQTLPISLASSATESSATVVSALSPSLTAFASSASGEETEGQTSEESEGNSQNNLLQFSASRSRQRDRPSNVAHRRKRYSIWASSAAAAVFAVGLTTTLWPEIATQTPGTATDSTLMDSEATSESGGSAPDAAISSQEKSTPATSDTAELEAVESETANANPATSGTGDSRSASSGTASPGAASPGAATPSVSTPSAPPSTGAAGEQNNPPSSAAQDRPGSGSRNTEPNAPEDTPRSSPAAEPISPSAASGVSREASTTTDDAASADGSEGRLENLFRRPDFSTASEPERVEQTVRQPPSPSSPVLEDATSGTVAESVSGLPSESDFPASNVPAIPPAPLPSSPPSSAIRGQESVVQAEIDSTLFNGTVSNAQTPDIFQEESLAANSTRPGAFAEEAAVISQVRIHFQSRWLSSVDTLAGDPEEAPEGPLVYRLELDETGEVISFTALNREAEAYRDHIFSSDEPPTFLWGLSEGVRGLLLRVVITPDGQVEVSPF